MTILSLQNDLANHIANLRESHEQLARMVYHQSVTAGVDSEHRVEVSKLFKLAERNLNAAVMMDARVKATNQSLLKVSGDFISLLAGTPKPMEFDRPMTTDSPDR